MSRSRAAQPALQHPAQHRLLPANRLRQRRHHADGGRNGQGAGQGVPGVTVYLIPATGIAPPTRATFSATTSGDGHYSIVGVEPGTYTVAAYKAGYSRAVTNAGVTFTVEGDANATASLTITPLPPGKISGIVHDTAGNLVPGAT